MSAPHHHVFNAMQREIYRSIMVEPLLPVLKDRGVISPKEDKLFREKSKNNIKILVGILRNQTFETFLNFVECICIAHESPEGEGKVEKPIVVSMRNVVEDFDSKHNTDYVKRVDEIIDRYKKTATFLEQTAEEEHTTLGEQETVPSEEGATASAMALLDISETTGDALPLPTLPYVSDPEVWSFTSSGDNHYYENFDLSLSVPPGTVSGSETLKIKVGACCYGPFSIPDKYFVVTAFYCIVANRKLQKPVKVEMGHCLLMPQYQQSGSVHILKADHHTVSTSDRHTFERLTHPEISSDRPYLSFKIQDFSILCGVVETKSEEQSSQLVMSTVQKLEQSGLCDNNRNMCCESTSSDMQESEQCSLDQLSDTDRDTRDPSSDKQHSGPATVSRRHQLKRQHSIEYESPALAKYRNRTEYAIILFESQNITLSPFSFFIFVCEYLHEAIQECRKQAEELGSHHLSQLLQVEFTDAEMKFVPDTSDVHAEIKAKATPVVKENQIHADMKQLRGLTDEKVYPPRVEFEVHYHYQLHHAMHCRVDVQGVTCSDFTAARFSINMPSVAPLPATVCTKAAPLFVGEIESQTFTQTGGNFYSSIHGISVDIPEQPIPSHVSSFEIKMRACLHGPFIFPHPDMEICSAVVYLSCDPSFHFASDVTVKIPHCAIIDSETNQGDFFILTAPDNEDSPYWNFSEKLKSEISACHVTVKVRHFSKIVFVSHKKKKEKYMSRWKQDKMKKLKESSLDSHMKYTRQFSLDSKTSDQASGITRQRASSSPAPFSRARSEDDVLSSSLSRFVVVYCAPKERSLSSWKVAFVISYSHPTGWMVAKQTAQSVLDCSSLSFDPVHFTFDEEQLQFEPAVWEQDEWEVEATKSPQIPRWQVVRYNKLPEEEQLSLVDFCPHLIYHIIKGTNSPKPLKCRIDVKGAESCGKPVYFMLTTPEAQVDAGQPSTMRHKMHSSSEGTLHSDAARPPSSKTCPSDGTTADSKPTVAQLTMLKNAKGEKVEIIKTIAPDWMEVGFLMDLDPKGRKIANIEAEHAHKRNGPVVCCREMFILWLDRPDATWQNLIELLVDSEQKDLAEQVKDALGL